MIKIKDLLVTPQQAAEIMGVPLRGIHRILEDCQVPKYWQGKHSRYKLEDVVKAGREIRQRIKEFDRFIQRHSGAKV